MLKFLPGSTIRWRATRFIVVDYADIDAIIARELGKCKLERIPVRDAKPDRTPGDQKAWTPDLVSIPAEAWKRAVTRFQVLKPLLEMDRAKRTFEKVQKVANALGRHPATIYRWMEAYERSERISVEQVSVFAVSWVCGRWRASGRSTAWHLGKRLRRLLSGW